MESYSELIQRALGNGTPKEQYENLKKIIEFLEALAFPKFNSTGQFLQIEDAAKKALFILEDLKQK